MASSAPPSPSGNSRAQSWIKALAAPLLIGVIIQNAGNLIFHAFVGRYLSASDYGALGTVLSLMILLAVPLGALQAAAAAVVASNGWSAKSIRHMIWQSTYWSLGIGFLTLLASPVITSFFHLSTVLDAALLAPYVAVSLALAIARGMLLGDKRITATAVSFVLSTVVRLTIGIGMAVLWGVTGALLGTVLGEAAALALCGWFILRRKSDPDARSGVLAIRPVMVSGIAIGGLFIFTTVDLFLARHYLSGPESGSYVAAATIAKTVLALPAAALSAGFPRLVAASQNLVAWKSELRRTFVVVVGLAVAAGLVIALLPRLVITILYGSTEFQDATSLVQVLALVAGFSSIISVLTYASLARGSWILFIPWGAAVFEIGLILSAHSTALEIARGSAIALGAAIIVMGSLVPLLNRQTGINWLRASD